jgi:hypothetical protein
MGTFNSTLKNSLAGSRRSATPSPSRRWPPRRETDAEHLATDLAELFRLGLIDLRVDGDDELRVEARDRG